jgi:lipopolysaccharide/colanic/teichoic acid biosynthesis glycosyltransferase
MMKEVGVRRTRVPTEAKAKLNPWCNSIGKRAWDLTCAVLLLMLFAPLMLAVALAVKLTSPGPILFRQRRPGKDGNEFTIFKFRTMVENGQCSGPSMTRAFDPRVTWFGRFMRKWKLDELPQLFNVIRGEMSFVGPRPLPSEQWRGATLREEAALVLSVRPGITSSTTLIFRNEEEVLASLPCDQMQEIYFQTLMPTKFKMEIQYLQTATFLSDLQVTIRTVGRVFIRREENDDFLKQCLSSRHGSPVSTASLPAKAEEAWRTATLSPLLELNEVRTMSGSTSAEESAGT